VIWCRLTDPLSITAPDHPFLGWKCAKDKKTSAKIGLGFFYASACHQHPALCLRAKSARAGFLFNLSGCLKLLLGMAVGASPILSACAVYILTVWPEVG